MAKKKKKQKKGPGKLRLFAERHLKLFTVIAVLIMLLPLAADFLLPEKDPVKQDGTTYDIVILDRADLLTDEEEEQLRGVMEAAAAYGRVAFLTNSDFCADTEKLSESVYRETFGRENGVIVNLDMYNRWIDIYSYGRIESVLTPAKNNTVTDNTYRYATSGDYYRFASETFRQIGVLLQGGMVPQPMKHIGNILLSLTIALVAVFIIANRGSRVRETDESFVFNRQAVKGMAFETPSVYHMVSQTRSKHVESSGGGGGHSGGGGGGGGGGGSHGGHGF